MRLKEHSVNVINGEVHFTLVSQSGHLVQPVTMGVGAARELAEEFLLAIHLHERAEREAEVLDRILADVEAAPGLVGRIEAAEMVAAMSEDDCGSMLADNDWDGLA